MTHNRALLGMLLCAFALTLTACPEDETTGVTPAPPAPSKMDMGMEEADMKPAVEVDMKVEADMKVVEVDMFVGPPDPTFSGEWILKEYDSDTETVGADIAEFSLLKIENSPEVTGSFTQGEDSGDVTGTLEANTLKLEWVIEALPYQFQDGTLDGEVIIGIYNDAKLGGVPQSAVMERK